MAPFVWNIPWPWHKRSKKADESYTMMVALVGIVLVAIAVHVGAAQLPRPTNTLRFDAAQPVDSVSPIVVALQPFHAKGGHPVSSEPVQRFTFTTRELRLPDLPTGAYQLTLGLQPAQPVGYLVIQSSGYGLLYPPTVGFRADDEVLCPGQTLRSLSDQDCSVTALQIDQLTIRLLYDR